MIDLALEGVTLRRGGRTVLDRVDLRFPAGRLTCVIGPNGAGKSTLLGVAAGLLAPSEGSVALDGTPLAGLPRRSLARRRAFLPQSPAVEWGIPVERVVALGLTPHLPAFGALPAAWQARIDAALTRYDLHQLRRRPATQLSGGELARVMLARATVGDPELLIIDEPTAGLDPRHALDAAARLRALADEGCTVLVALHDLDLALRMADDVVAVKGGRVLAAGPALAILDDAVLSELYDTPARVIHDKHGAAVRFLA
ncbi:ABC transporter ATP-binding protein [Sphingomonas jatrophae]|uniref:Iron complex transport system ATP-binding protein n=1 Tax=Sphingomonas jatrophae TaxID=1166337 RepID=A0A1I6JBP5_9SPHN|nr:ABC transporter ATP-binding protein [Sphingomonas jatrophae]SFR76415.1 iron complex transport system ATP-binding protein [Sphingomonas jatrophae]